MEALARIETTDARREPGAHAVLSAGLLDGCLQLLTAVFPGNELPLYMPIGCDQVRYFDAAGAPHWCHSVVRSFDADIATGDGSLYDADGGLAVEWKNARFKKTAKEALERSTAHRYEGFVYGTEWRRARARPGSMLPTRRYLLVCSAPSGFALALQGQLLARGQEVSIVSPTQALDVSEESELVLLDAIRATDIEQMERVMAASLELVQGCLASARPVRLHFVTHGVHGFPTGAAVHPEQALLWGLGRVLANEDSARFGALIDLRGDVQAEASTERLAEQLLTFDDERQVLLHPDERWGLRLVRNPVRGGTALRVHSDKSYLVTGALGKLGKLVCRWLVAQGARSVVLVARRTPEEAGEQFLRELRERGARVRLVLADVADREALRPAFEAAGEAGFHLGGIVHTAGSLDDGIILRQTWSRLERAFAPKVRGTINLHSLAGDAALDFFVSFSSIVGLLGSAGQLSHASANCFLDAHAAHRQGQGARATSIGWGPWSDTGLGEEALKRVAAAGFALLDTDSGLAAFAQLATAQPAYGLVAALQWDKIGTQFAGESVPALFRDLLIQDAEAVKHSDAEAVLAMLRGAQPQARRSLVMLHVLIHARRVLSLSHDAEIDPERPLQDAGLDSLMALELRRALARSLEMTLPATLLFDQPSLEALSAYLHDRLFEGDAVEQVQRAAETNGPDRARGELEQLSEAEADARLRQKLAHYSVGPGLPSARPEASDVTSAES
jgi:NAD(P)-dependent dehydrogenase (short-subunit alcohol dehydrogenase family)/acyl carrier protein